MEPQGAHGAVTLGEVLEQAGAGEVALQTGADAQESALGLNDDTWETVAGFLTAEQRERLIAVLNDHQGGWGTRVASVLRSKQATSQQEESQSEDKMPWSQLPEDVRDEVAGYLPSEDHERMREAGLELKADIAPVNNPGVRTVYTQAELDEALDDPATLEIHLEANSGTVFEITDARSTEIPVRAMGAVQVRVTGDGRIIAHHNAQVTVTTRCTVFAFDTAQVTATGGAIVYAFDNSHVTATGGAAFAFDTAQVTMTGGLAGANDTARVAINGGQVMARDTSHVDATGNTHLMLHSAGATYSAVPNTVQVDRMF